MDWTTRGNVTRGVGKAGVTWYVTALRLPDGSECWSLHAKGAGGGFMDAGRWRTREAAMRFAEDEDL